MLSHMCMSPAQLFPMSPCLSFSAQTPPFITTDLTIQSGDVGFRQHLSCDLPIRAGAKLGFAASKRCNLISSRIVSYNNVRTTKLYRITQLYEQRRDFPRSHQREIFRNNQSGGALCAASTEGRRTEDVTDLRESCRPESQGSRR